MDKGFGRGRSYSDNLPGHKRVASRAISYQHGRAASANSGPKSSQAFFDIIDPVPLHSSTTTWKSEEQKEKEEYHRVRSRIRHFAPEQLRERAYPTDKPCDIFPMTLADWRQHKLDLIKIACEEHEENARLMKAQVAALQNVPAEKRTLKPVFGSKGKIFSDGLGPVLCQPTIWSHEHLDARNIKAAWPTVVEMKREGINAGQRPRIGSSYRLPPPCLPAIDQEPFHHRILIQPYPLDQTRPVFHCGPRQEEVEKANFDMDNDPEFEAQGRAYLGDELMGKLGAWQPQVLPEWRVNERLTKINLEAVEFCLELGKPKESGVLH